MFKCFSNYLYLKFKVSKLDLSPSGVWNIFLDFLWNNIDIVIFCIFILVLILILVIVGKSKEREKYG